MRKGRREYKVKWVGWDKGDNTWELQETAKTPLLWTGQAAGAREKASKMSEASFVVVTILR